MTLAAYVILVLVVFGGGLLVGWMLRGAPHQRPQGPGFMTLPTETADPVDIAEHMGGLPPLNGRRDHVYGVVQVRGAHCIDHQCRLKHPDPDIVLGGVGLSGSVYQCRHCLTTW